MRCSNESLEEIRLLSQFNLEAATGSGLKVHSQEADAAVVEAASRLYSKGLTDQVDGGYLTERGIEAASHAQCLMRLLTAEQVV